MFDNLRLSISIYLSVAPLEEVNNQTLKPVSDMPVVETVIDTTFFYCLISFLEGLT